METTTSRVRPGWLPEQVWPYPLKTLMCSGHRVVYTDTGGDKPVLLLVHVGLWSLIWRDLISRLSDDYRCITLDVPGTGLSDRVAAREQNLDTAATAIGAVLDEIDTDVTLVVHDLGGLATLAAASTRLDRVRGLVAVNTFGWRPRGLMLPPALRFFGTSLMRELDAWTGLLPNASATRFGVGRHWDRATKRAWRAGLRDRSARRFFHRLFRDAAHNHHVPAAAEKAVAGLRSKPLTTVFGQLGDYFFFQHQWQGRRPGLTRVIVPRGYHFPMCDNPDLTARAITSLGSTRPQ
ncbi:alpha/beta fold hydrolase [Kribbella sp. C-35]|uniref:alpha/beta fold hydrolase n=1 Tax=Kribbella sp. C-35 TaxID=2789276 RepID=UPI0039782114